MAIGFLQNWSKPLSGIRINDIPKQKYEYCTGRNLVTFRLKIENIRTSYYIESFNGKHNKGLYGGTNRTNKLLNALLQSKF